MSGNSRPQTGQRAAKYTSKITLPSFCFDDHSEPSSSSTRVSGIGFPTPAPGRLPRNRSLRDDSPGSSDENCNMPISAFVFVGLKVSDSSALEPGGILIVLGSTLKGAPSVRMAYKVKGSDALWLEISMDIVLLWPGWTAPKSISDALSGKSRLGADRSG